MAYNQANGVPLAESDADYARVDGTHPFTAPVAGVTPVAAHDLTTLEYVNAKLTTGVVLHPSVRFVIEDDVVLPAHTYNNGALGVGATLTADANGTIPTFDGVTPAPGDRCLVEHHLDLAWSGIYEVTAVGAPDVPGPGAPWVLTRATLSDESADIEKGMLVLIDEGTTHGGVLEMMNAYPGIVIGTDPQLFMDLFPANSITASLGVELVGLDVRAHLDGTSLARGAAGIKVNILETDAQHGARGGGTQHAGAIAGGAAGFLSGADKTKLDGVEAGANATTEARVLAGLAATAGNKDMGGGAITNVGVVDGRDLSADGLKLDGMEAGANVTTTARVLAGLAASIAAKDLGGGSVTNVNLVDGRDVSVDGAKTDGIEAGAQVTSATHVLAALAATAGAKDLGGGAVTNTGLIMGRNVPTDGTKLDGIEAGADVTRASNTYAVGCLQWRKKVIDHTTLVGIATTEDVTLLAASAGDMIHDVFFDLTAALGGGGATSCTISAGITGTVAGFVAAQNVFTGQATGRKGITAATKGALFLDVTNGDPVPSPYQVAAGGTTVLCRVTVGGAGATTGALSAGSLTVYYLSARPVVA